MSKWKRVVFITKEVNFLEMLHKDHVIALFGITSFVTKKLGKGTRSKRIY